MEVKPKLELAKRTYTNEQINELADWVNNLTIDQLLFLKDSYENFMAIQLAQEGCTHVH